MMSSHGLFWMFWMFVMFLMLAPTVGYGSGYRRWGVPYPRYIQRRRGQRAAGRGGVNTFDHSAWGRGGDFVWILLSLGILWAVAGLWWRI